VRADGQPIENPDVAPLFEHDRQQPQTSSMFETFRRSLVDTLFPRSRSSDKRRGRPWLPRQRTRTDASWKRSPASDDNDLDAAIGKVEELIARRRLLQEWLKEVLFTMNKIT